MVERCVLRPDRPHSFGDAPSAQSPEADGCALARRIRRRMAGGGLVKVDASSLERATPAPAASPGGSEPRGAMGAMVLLSDLDSLIREAQDEDARVRLRKLGFALDGLPRLLIARQRLAETS